MVKLLKQSWQNPKLEQRELKDGTIALYPEYYLGQKEELKKGTDGNVMYYTPSKANWVEIGMTLSDLDEARQEYFHNVSCIYSGHNRAKTDRKFSELLKNTTKVKIATFFLHYKEHGLNLVSWAVCLREYRIPVPAGNLSASEQKNEGCRHIVHPHGKPCSIPPVPFIIVWPQAPYTQISKIKKSSFHFIHLIAPIIQQRRIDSMW